MITLDTPLIEMPRIAQRYHAKLKKLDLVSVRDLLFHFPVRYEDFSVHTPIADLVTDQKATLIATVDECKMRNIPNRKLTVTTAKLSDDTGTITATWWNQPYVADQLTPGKKVRISGTVKDGKRGRELTAAVHERIARTPTNTGRLVPIYPETAGLSSRWLRWQIQIILKNATPIEEIIPDDVLKTLAIPRRDKALSQIHFPDDHKAAAHAQKRFVCEELFTMQCATLLLKASHQNHKALPLAFDEKLIKNFVTKLPFTLTDAQRKASYQILKDCERPRPMHRLLNGDVGSGKTIVALIAALQCAKTGAQVALLAPTEVLARQHFESFIELLSEQEVMCGLFTHAYQRYGEHPALIKESKRKDLLKKIKNGDITIIIGTHALLQEDVAFARLALIIIDEQHRFGVAQRAYLQEKATALDDGSGATVPHFLTMTATPIPRTLSIVLFGDLDVSLLDELPKNRLPIKTSACTQKQYNKIYAHVREEINNGRQAYVILPLVEESSAIAQTKAATVEYERLQKTVFTSQKIGLIHGRMKAKEKEAAMDRFKNKEIDILVATAVVEVGIDVPNATIMIIENAERFGLSQLHQFRGRIGRSTHQSYCYLFAKNVEDNARLKVLEKYSDGFKIAQADLRLRGPGQFFGARQSGLPDGAMHHITNLPLLAQMRELAQKTLASDPGLKNHPHLAQALIQFMKNTHLE